LPELVTLITDFGLKDSYVGAMKGVLKTLAPDLEVIDISHEIPSQDVAAAAWVLNGAYPYFPDHTVHVVVVDPGVGTDRKGVAVDTNQGSFIGPDNGVFSGILSTHKGAKIVALENPKLMREKVSSTFHGRDIFAPAAAHLCLGTPLGDFGEGVADPVILEMWEVEEGQNELVGHVVHVDRFGNSLTNLSRDMLVKEGKELSQIRTGDHRFSSIRKTYGDTPSGEAAVLLGSNDMLEIAVTGGDASSRLGIKRGDKVLVRWE